MWLQENGVTGGTFGLHQVGWLGLPAFHRPLWRCLRAPSCLMPVPSSDSQNHHNKLRLSRTTRAKAVAHEKQSGEASTRGRRQRTRRPSVVRRQAEPEELADRPGPYALRQDAEDAAAIPWRDQQQGQCALHCQEAGAGDAGREEDRANNDEQRGDVECGEHWSAPTEWSGCTFVDMRSLL